ncbi:hypothetical protein LMG7141_00725 [Ralstonia condita]|jgi:uncharacterized iron-regulated membrane protein|uniref:Uncharacterized protein n=1 Tax=Ralstonia condita TaxID=3058600 RepID=A0ABN9IFA6_9RALS|nr:hypothetical protein [Ralstonia sp. LMG 7141]MDE2204668.1 hypothetical protein [Burkholderiaceae bacterium]CAJ0778209.1 hypothetical protein LMG7141_00725 [Ralstonia sp. LMG 7141]
MSKVVLALLVVAAAVFYIVFKAPQTDTRAPASTATPGATALAPPPGNAPASAATASAPASIPAASEPVATSAPRTTRDTATEASAPPVKP